MTIVNKEKHGALFTTDIGNSIREHVAHYGRITNSDLAWRIARELNDVVRMSRARRDMVRHLLTIALDEKDRALRELVDKQ